MITNRPKPIRELFRGKFFPVAFDAWNYFNDLPTGTNYTYPQTYHGMRVTLTTASEVWQSTVRTIGNSGVCTHLAVAFLNNQGQSRNIGIRLYVDGEAVFTDELIPVAGNRNTGFCLIGKFIFTSSGLKDIYNGLCPFHNSFVLETFTQNNAHVQIAVARRIYWTS